MRGQGNDRGFTLLELMVAVAILGILTGILVLSLNGPAAKVKAGSEVSAMFAEFHRGQSQYALENGIYYSTGFDEADVFPSTPVGQSQDPGTLPDEWDTLKLRPTSGKLYCGYVTVAGTADDDIPGFADDFGMSQPAANWYVLFAHCNVDNNSAVDSYYFSSSVDTGVKKRNDGR